MSAGFRSEFDSRYVGKREGRPCFRLLEPLVYYSEHLKREIVVPGSRVHGEVAFVTDLASVPRWVGAYLIAGGQAVRAAVVHDYLYEKGCLLAPDGSRLVVARVYADEVFHEAMVAENDPEEGWRRWAMWAAVRSFGWVPFNKYRKADGTYVEPPPPEQPLDPSPGG